VYGTLSFAGFQPREDRFSATDKDLIRLMAQWLGAEIEKTAGAKKHAIQNEAPVTRPAPKTKVKPSRKPAIASSLLKVDRTIHANRILKRIEAELRSLAGEQLELELKLASDLGLAIAPRVALGAIVKALVINARDAMPEGGKVVIETANLELVSGKPDVIPAVVPARYVTLSVRDSGSAPDAEQLAQIYQSVSHGADLKPDAAHRLSLSAIYRILQASGGDLSVVVEPDRGSTFTLYLPLAKTLGRTSRKIAPAPSAPSASV
jgi:two-component sensor histidine kinase